MNNNDESIPILVNLGLSTIQAKIYLTFLTSDANTAQETATFSKVSRPDVYRVLTQLEEKKIVEKIIDRPTKYQAVPIEICTSILLEQRTKLMKQQTRELMETRKKIPMLIQRLKENTKKEHKGSKSDFILISKEAFYLRSEKMIRSAKESIFVVAPNEKPVFPVTNFQSAVENALSKNVDCRIVVPDPKNQKIKDMLYKRASHFRNFKFRFIKNKTPSAIIIFDRKEVLFGIQPIDNLFDSANFSAIWSNNQCFIDLLVGYFYDEWRKNNRPDQELV